MYVDSGIQDGPWKEMKQALFSVEEDVNEAAKQAKITDENHVDILFKKVFLIAGCSMIDQFADAWNKKIADLADKPPLSPQTYAKVLNNAFTKVLNNEKLKTIFPKGQSEIDTLA